MSVEHPKLDGIDPLAGEDDLRLQLVRRILATDDFIRSPQLSKFLTYICAATFEGRSHILSEQHIGVELFGREPDYDSAADTIVRSHALRLRRRLEQFFQRAGSFERIHLIIPRGGYVPVFLPSPKYTGSEKQAASFVSNPTATDQTANFSAAPDAVVSADRQRGSGQSSPLHDSSGSAEFSVKPYIEIENVEEVSRSDWAASKHQATVIWRYRVATMLLASLCIGLAVVLIVHLRAHFLTKRHHPLWGQLFTEDQPTHIVLGDSGLVLFHAVARQRVSLHDYLSDDVSKQMPFVQHVDPGFAQFLLHRRYTSTVDATALTHLLRLPEAMPERTLVHYSRDMHLNDFKTGNVIMIGAQEAVPWVELFESHMDFVSSIENSDTHASFINRHPFTGELTEYDSTTPATRTKVYAVLAFLPNLSATGNVLILEGLSMAGTEAAVDLAMDDDRLRPILARIRKPNGSLPHFEMLLESDTLGESAGPARMVALHLHD